MLATFICKHVLLLLTSTVTRSFVGRLFQVYETFSIFLPPTEGSFSTPTRDRVLSVRLSIYKRKYKYKGHEIRFTLQVYTWDGGFVAMVLPSYLYFTY